MSQHHRAQKWTTHAPKLREKWTALLPRPCLECGQPVTKRDRWHVGHIRAAEDGGNSALELGRNLYTGANGFAVDYPEARKWLGEAVSRGLDDAGPLLVLATLSTYLVYRTIQSRPAKEVEVASAFAVVAAHPLPLGTMLSERERKRSFRGAVLTRGRD